MTDNLYLIAQGSIAIFTGAVVTLAYSTIVRWIMQTFEHMINVMDGGHFHRTYD